MNVYILLDRSGSMSTMWKEAIGSINGYIEKLSAKDKVHLAVFDSISHDVIRDCKVSEWKKISDEEVSPRGGTPLYDSCGKVMSLAEEADARKTMLIVMTDGFENASHEYSQAAIKAKVSTWETDKKWEVVFLGANFDAVETVSNSIGVVGSKTLNYGAGNFARGMDVLATATMAYASAGTAVNFSDADKRSVGA